MAASGHTYGRSCLLSPEFNALTYTASDVSSEPPPIKAHFFYCSSLPIDDPLAPVPPPASNVASKPPKLPPRPFSVLDSLALESAWLESHKPESSKEGVLVDVEEEPVHISSIPPKNSGIVDQETHNTRVRRSLMGEKADIESAIERGRSIVASARSCSTERGRSGTGSRAATPDITQCNDHDQILFEDIEPITAEEIQNDDFAAGLGPRSMERKKSLGRSGSGASPGGIVDSKSVTSMRVSRGTQRTHESQTGTSPSDRDTTGTPFLRVPSRLKRIRSRSPNVLEEYTSGIETSIDGQSEVSYHRPNFGQAVTGLDRSRSKSREDQFRGLTNKSPQIAQVVVGVQQLHMVELPNLKMGPVYWDPVHDVSSVVRGTWFYKETMWPVEAAIANQIEEGYEYIKPWTSSYVDELNSCEGIGPEAELKLVHKICPVDDPARNSSRPRMGQPSDGLSMDQQDRQQAKRTAGFPRNRAAGHLDGFDDPARLFAKASMMYTNARDAQILQPNQLPSVARGRRPLHSIRKGRAVGIPVVRGFDNRLWEKLHPPSKLAATAMNILESHEVSHAIQHFGAERIPECGACRQVERRKKPTDLILVIHGIGQKLSERVESFHFTHAINAFRRQINMELESDAVKPWLRQGVGGVVVLPVNWRSKVHLEEGGPESDPNHRDRESLENQYTLKDITAESLPAIRSLISDVMLDIPYYFSHHKLKMIEAVIKEANRIYRLWCTRNPGFDENGRVHILAHSLGSVMALDVLSKQPTELPKQLDSAATNPRSDIFEFDTKNLFLCGSPAGLFLLLQHAPLLPRKGRHKPDAEIENGGTKITGSVGTYGCLAVDNIYNISHQFDPIAYKINACVDVKYAASLKRAFVPSASASWAQYLTSVFKGKTVAQSKTMDGLEGIHVRPNTARMPSTVEMETHDFTQEEIAEKRMYLLNDNGQIDYILRSGGGPLEIQYLNMLSAHNAYWVMDDFVRFIVVETGRKPGKSQTLNNMKAVKKAWVDK